MPQMFNPFPSTGRDLAAIAVANTQQATDIQRLKQEAKIFDIQWADYLKQQALAQDLSGYTSTGLSSLVNEYNKAFHLAKTAEDQRYKEMLGLTDKTTGQRAADIRSDYATQRSNMMQNLARTGMANTTVAPTLSAGIEREEQSSLNRLADQMLGTKLGIMQGKQERYPTTDIITTLAQLLNQQPQISGPGGSKAVNPGAAGLLSALGNITMTGEARDPIVPVAFKPTTTPAKAQSAWGGVSPAIRWKNIY